MISRVSAVVILVTCAQAQEVTIRVHANEVLATYKPIYGYFGYDEPNYTYTANGKKLVGELGALSSNPVYIRTHFLLVTGDGTPSLKFGSTNAYTEDSPASPHYDWTLVDRIFDTYLGAGAKPFVEIGFMPKALSSHPEPYFGGEWIPGAANKGYYAGWSYPPNDYKKWGELVYQWVRHCVQKYGAQEAASWYWEVWNEPDIAYWHGTPEEYDELYDYSADAVKRALPAARVGGPASTSPANAKAGAFLRQFLQHCTSGKNFVSGKQGAPLDFITFHAKGQPKVVDGRVQMGISKNAGDVDAGARIVAAFPEFRQLPIVLSESDPEGCAACSARVYPQNAYRNGALYAAYEAAMMKTIIEISDQRQANIRGMLTWAFEFENQPWFDGFRTLATNGVDKPVLNFFRMAGLMLGDRVRAESGSAVKLDDLLKTGVPNQPDVDALAVRSGRQISVLAWNYHDDDVHAPAAQVRFQVDGIPPNVRRVLVRRYGVDETHSNSWTAWKAMGSPQHPTAEEMAKLQQTGQLQLLESPKWVNITGGKIETHEEMPRPSVSLVEVSWADWPRPITQSAAPPLDPASMRGERGSNSLGRR